MIIFDGDSITEGTTINNFKYSEYLTNLSCCENIITKNFGKGGAWVGGNGTPERIHEGINNSLDYRYQYIKPYGGHGHDNVFLHIAAGTNDLAPNYGNLSSLIVISNLLDYVSRAQKDGFTVILGTILPRFDDIFKGVAESNRQTVNNAIITKQIPADYVVDYASMPIWNNPNSFHDQVHPTIDTTKDMALFLNSKLLPILNSNSKL